jgi:putative ABC transport system permease protein
MNLAIRDIRHNLARFLLTAVGIGLLLMLVMGMGGIYRGLVQDATLLVDAIGADLWVVQKDTRGPFAEPSRIPANMEDRVRAVPGVESVRAFLSGTVQLERSGVPFRVTIQGLSWPEDRGDWLPIVAGRPLGQAHYEMIADELLGLAVGETVDLAKDRYTVVGLTRSMVSLSGDGMAFLALRDAQAVMGDAPPEASRMERASRYLRARETDIGHTHPTVVESMLGPTSRIPSRSSPLISAVVVKVLPGVDPASVAAAISQWPDVSVHGLEDQHRLLVRGPVDRARQQLALFRILLIAVSAIIMALILYTLTLDKLHDIAMLKLMGARNRVVLGLILQQALLLGAIGFAIAYAAGSWVFPRFPRRVIIVPRDLAGLGLTVVLISVLSCVFGIWRALRVEPNQVIN